MKSFAAPFLAIILLGIMGCMPPAEAQGGVPPVMNIELGSGPNPGEVVISWDAVPQATHYRIGYVNMEVDYHLAKASCTGEWIEAFVYVDVNARNIPVRNGRAEYTVRRIAQGARHAFTVLTSNDFVDSGGGGSVRSEFFWPSNPRWKFLPGRDRLPQGITLPTPECSAGKMYWTDAWTDKIQRANLDGSDVEDLVTSGLDHVLGLALDVGAGKMYWTDQGANKISRANLDGSGAEDLAVFESNGPFGLALDTGAGKMYWTDEAPGTDYTVGVIRRANLDGSGLEDLFVTSGARSPRPDGLTLDAGAGKMYWTASFARGEIRRVNLDGSGAEDLVTGLDSNIYGLALDVGAGKMYWTVFNMGKIQRANLDGSGVEDLVTGLDTPNGLALDLAAGKMYWTLWEAGKIQRANLDGGGVEDLVTGLSRPSSLALDLGGP